MSDERKINRHLVVYDDVFPDMRSGFRLRELGAYLEHFPEAQVLVANFAGRSNFERVVDLYATVQPRHRARISFIGDEVERAGLLYCMFLNNAFDMLALAEGWGVPFGFQLYPGGGLRLEDTESDTKLRRVFDSPQFTFVVVTQPNVRDYVLTRFALPEERVFFIGPGPVWHTTPDDYVRASFGRDKPTFDIGFIAHRYGDDLRIKGYDFFIAMARALATTCAAARFYVIGDYRPSDCALGAAAGRITFHGPLGAAALDGICRRLDVVVSPNVPAANGGFDGFPTASCSQAALAGALVMATDPLGLNHALVDGRDFLLVERDPQELLAEDVARAANKLRALTLEPERFEALRTAGQQAFTRLLGDDTQITPRIALLERALAGKLAPPTRDREQLMRALAVTQERAFAERREIARLHGLIDNARDYIAGRDRYVAELLADKKR